MKIEKSVKFLLVLIALLLAANLVQPIVTPSSVYADDKESPDAAITGAGTTAWVLRGNQVFYMKFEQQFESIRVYGPEDLEE